MGADRPACLARELTKTHEELVRGPLGTLLERYAAQRPLGEITIVVGGTSEEPEIEAVDDPAVAERARRLLAAGYSTRDVAEILATETDRGRKETYALVLGLARA